MKKVLTCEFINGDQSLNQWIKSRRKSTFCHYETYDQSPEQLCDIISTILDPLWHVCCLSKSCSVLPRSSIDVLSSRSNPVMLYICALNLVYSSRQLYI